MNKSFAVAVVCVLAAGLAGCATQPAAAKPAAPAPVRLAAPNISPADKNAVVSGEDDFLMIVGAAKYEMIKSLVLPGEAAGFDGKSFVEDRFRMKMTDFTMVGWDMNTIGVTSAKHKGDVLTSCVVTAKVIGSEAARPVVVNLYWRKEGGRWYLVPYPEAE